MHPVAKCCSLYCSCVMVSGIFFFAIIAIMESNKNIFLTRGKTQTEIDEKVNVLYIVIGVCLAMAITCLGLFVTGSRKEQDEEQRQRELDVNNARQGIDIF